MAGFLSASICPSVVVSSIFGGLGLCPFGATRRILPNPCFSRMSCPPTIGSNQSETKTDPSVPTATSLGRNHRRSSWRNLFQT
jgi:hypothetical protein